MTDALEQHPERGKEKCVVFLTDDGRAGTQLHGYDEDTEAVVDVLMHLQAVFKANGKQLIIAPLGSDG